MKVYRLRDTVTGRYFVKGTRLARGDGSVGKSWDTISAVKNAINMMRELGPVGYAARAVVEVSEIVTREVIPVNEFHPRKGKR